MPSTSTEMIGRRQTGGLVPAGDLLRNYSSVVATVYQRRIRRLVALSHERAHDPNATPLERLRHLHDLARHLVDYNIELAKQARADGCTWAEIGAAVGISERAAHKRYHQFTRR